jgi:hypothetical protein
MPPFFYVFTSEGTSAADSGAAKRNSSGSIGGAETHAAING